MIRTRPSRILPLLAAVAFACTACAAARDPLAGAIVQTDVMVPMRDGVKLATDVVRPRDAGRRPAVLIRTPYRKSSGHAAAALREGYVLVVQDVRGRYKSEGEFYPFLNEGKDAFDTVEWIAKQDWCDGNVGMTGASYLGFTQLAAALANPPHLRCIIPSVPPADMDDGTAYRGGALRQELVQGWMIGQAGSSQRMLRPPGGEDPLKLWPGPRSFAQWATHLPLRDPGPIALGGDGYVKGWLDMIDSWEKPGQWAVASAARRPADIKVPVLIKAGFFDIFTQENIDLLLALRKAGGSDESRRHSHLIIGPWVHGLGRPAGDADFPAARAHLAAADGPWLARWLRGLKGEGIADVDNWPAIHAFVANQERWVDTDTWPPRGAVATRLYLNGKALARDNPAAPRPPDAFKYDPADPVQTLGGGNLSIVSGVRDHRRNSLRPDVLTYSSEPLAEDLTVVGPLKAHLTVSTGAADTDFTAMLLDVRPDGYMGNVVDGIVRLRYRGGRAKPQPVKPGEVVEVDIDLWSTAWCFKAGHRLALHVSSSNFPKFDRHLNTADPPAAWTKGVVAENKVHQGGAQASYVELPVMK